MPYENSIAAYARSLVYQDGFECDVCACADGTLFLIHEAKYVDAHIGVEYCLAEHLNPESIAYLNGRKLEELRTEEAEKLRLKDGSPLPKLEEVLRLFTGTQKTLIAELKGHNVHLPFIKVMKKAFSDGVLEPTQVIVGGFNHAAVIAVKKALPVKVNLTFTDAPEVPMFPWHPNATAFYKRFCVAGYVEALLATVTPDYIMLPHSLVGHREMRLFNEKYPHIGIHSWVFTERAACMDEHAFIAALKAAQAHNLQAILIDIPERTAHYR